MRSSIFGHLGAGLRDYLCDIIQRAPAADDPAARNLGRVELPRVAAALRAVLDEHEPDRRGRCRTCRTRKFRRTPAPCRAFLTAHLSLLFAEEEPPGEPITIEIEADCLGHHLDAPG